MSAFNRRWCVWGVLLGQKLFPELHKRWRLRSACAVGVLPTRQSVRLVYERLDWVPECLPRTCFRIPPFCLMGGTPFCPFPF